MGLLGVCLTQKCRDAKQTRRESDQAYKLEMQRLENEELAIRQAGRTDRVDSRQGGRTDRVGERQGGRLARVSERQGGRTDRVDSRQGGRTDRLTIRAENDKTLVDAHRDATESAASLFEDFFGGGGGEDAPPPTGGYPPGAGYGPAYGPVPGDMTSTYVGFGAVLVALALGGMAYLAAR